MSYNYGSLLVLRVRAHKLLLERKLGMRNHLDLLLLRVRWLWRRWGLVEKAWRGLLVLTNFVSVHDPYSCVDWWTVDGDHVLLEVMAWGLVGWSEVLLLLLVLVLSNMVLHLLEGIAIIGLRRVLSLLLKHLVLVVVVRMPRPNRLVELRLRDYDVGLLLVHVHH